MSSNVTLPSAPAIEAQALLRHLRMSPQKIRLVVDLIRGQRAEDALHILRYTKKRAARDIEKVLRSAIANAERKAEDAGASLDVDELYVSRCFVNEGSRWKRLRPAPDGPRLSLPEAHGAYRRRGRGTPSRRGGAYRGCGSRRCLRKGRAWRGKESAQSPRRRQAGAGAQTQETRVRGIWGRSCFGTENTSIWVSPRL